MRLRLAGCLLSLAAMVALPDAAAGRPGGTPPAESLTISGSTGGYVDVVLTRSVHFDWAKPGLDVKGGRQYAGFCMQAWRLAHRARPIPCGARLNVVDEKWLMGAGGIVSDLLPGKYRVYLLADGPATATIPLAGLGRRLMLNAAGLAPRAQVTLTDATGPIGLEAGRWRQRMFAKDNGASWTGWYFVGMAPTKVQYFDLCLAPVGGECLLVANTFGDGRAVNFGGPGVNGQGGMGAALTWGPDHSRMYQGPYDAIMTNAATDIDVRAQGFSLDIDFSPGPPAIR